MQQQQLQWEPRYIAKHVLLPTSMPTSKQTDEQQAETQQAADQQAARISHADNLSIVSTSVLVAVAKAAGLPRYSYGSTAPCTGMLRDQHEV